MRIGEEAALRRSIIRFHCCVLFNNSVEYKCICMYLTVRTEKEATLQWF